MKRFLKGTENLLGKSNGGIKEYFLNNFPQKVCRYKKKQYLCIAFERKA